jgi:hypothetical protein
LFSSIRVNRVHVAPPRFSRTAGENHSAKPETNTGTVWQPICFERGQKQLSEGNRGQTISARDFAARLLSAMS